MTIFTRPQDVLVTDVFVHLGPVVRPGLYLKCEGFNFAGSAKLLAARSMVEGAERRGLLSQDSVVIESSSGNLGVALAVVCANRGYPFTCVVDPLSSPVNRRLIESLGGHLHMVRERDPLGSYLGTRIETVARMCLEDSRYVWLDQYANDDNWKAHHRWTAVAIHQEFTRADFLIIGTGTGGTLMGCARYFKEHSPRTRIVAVDAVGSVSFGGAPFPRHLPGIGTSRRPAILDPSYIDEVVHVGERETIAMCRRLARHGYLFGASTGSVLCGAAKALANAPAEAVAVAIAPDMGDRYLGTVYDDEWSEAHYGSLDNEKEKEEEERVPDGLSRRYR